MSRALINLSLISSLVAFIIVSTVEISWGIYFSVFLLQIILLGVNFSFSKNKLFSLNMLIINTTFFIVYCMKNYNLSNSINNGSLDKVYFTIILCCLITVAYLLLLSYLDRKKYIDGNTKIIGKREQDLNQLEYYIGSFQIVGINGEWGTGKTFLVNELKKRLTDSYEFIEIDLLVSNLNEMQLTLVNSFEELLYSKRIIPKYANKLKKDISSASFVSKIQSVLNLVFTSSDSKAETLKSFMEKTEKLDKKILIIYEDIDRIENKEIVKEIFAISEKLANTNNNIKIIYQYDEKLLVEQKFSHRYLEKYIPFKMSLTELHFIEIIEFELKDKYKDVLSIEDFKYLQLQEFRFNILTDVFEYREEYVLSIEYISIRKVQDMLAELNFVLLKKKNELAEYKDLVISFYILKHFIPEQYEKLNSKQNLFEAIQFKFEEKSYTIIDLINMDINDLTLSILTQIFESEENRNNYGILKLFNFDIVSKRMITDAKRFNELKQESKHKHDKMDRIIWKLLYEGKSIFTDYENAVQKICEYVLDLPKDEQLEGFKKYQYNFFYSNEIVAGNNTIFKIGMDQFENIYEAFKIAQVSEDYRIKLNEFYFEYRKSSEIDLAFIRCLNYAKIATDKEYLQIVKYFNQLNVTSNFNTSKEFLYFVQKFIKGLAQVKLINSYDYFFNVEKRGEINFKQEINFIKERLDPLVIEVQRTIDLYARLNLFDFVFILKDIEAFIKKILEIMESPDDYPMKSVPFINSEITSRYANQEEYDRLKDLIIENLGLEAIKEEISESYKNDTISFYEVTRLLEENERFLL